MKKLALTALCLGFIAACGGGKDNNDTIDAGDVTLPDGTTVDAPGVDTCDPLAQTGCNGDDRCTWIWDSLDNPDTTPVEAQVGHLGCASNASGTVDNLAACVRSGPTFGAVMGQGAGVADNCKKGSYCLGSVCKSICDHAGGAPACGDDFACNRYSGIFQSMGMTIAGICDPKCDPVTQKTLAGSLEACASPDATMPAAGCFQTAGTTAIGLGFSCARVPAESATLLDGSPAYGPTSGGAYSNGCAAGYLPFFVSPDDSTLAICTGTCAPADSDSSNPATQANSVGNAAALAKLPNQMVARVGDGLCTNGKKGRSGVAEDCTYLWVFNFDDSMPPNLIDSPFNDTVGVCYPYSLNKFDPDNNGPDDNGPLPPTTPRPSCSQLVAPAGTPVDPYPFHAWEYNCYSSVRTAEIQAMQPPRSASTPRRQFQRNWRLVQNRSGETAFRHVLL